VAASKNGGIPQDFEQLLALSCVNLTSIALVGEHISGDIHGGRCIGACKICLITGNGKSSVGRSGKGVRAPGLLPLAGLHKRHLD
jgi:hypothetical protein